MTHEEEYLRGRFGAEYAEYCRNVRRFIPRPLPYRPSVPSPKNVSPAEGLASERRTLQAIALVVGAIVVIYVVRLQG